MKFIAFFFCLFFQDANSQTSKSQFNVADNGIKWVTGMSWDDIKAKAKKENKYIFVDCYATWCGPCKVMDAKVYPNDTIGRLMNTNFISVKVQLDTSKSDDEQIKSWYATAKKIKNDYAVVVMPTFLVFAPDGQVVHKDLGYKNVSQFILLIQDATNPENQYYNLVRKFRAGKLEYKQMSTLATLAMKVEEKEFAFEVARAYLNYSNSLPEAELCTKDNLIFTGKFLSILKSSDKLFGLCLLNPDRVNALARKGFATDIVNYVITKEEVKSVVKIATDNKQQPNWKKIHKTIKNKYGIENADRVTLTEKVYYYKSNKDYSSYAKFLVKKVEMEKEVGTGNYSSANYLNDNAWQVFLYSNSKVELKKALVWSERSLQLDTSSINVGLNMDTRANLLYKIGRINEAIKQQEQAIQRIEQDMEKQKIPFDGGPESIVKSMKKTLQDMTRREPTHISNGAIWNKDRRQKKY